MLSVKLSDLKDALMWVSADPMGSNEAWIDRETGRIYWESDEDGLLDEQDTPDDLGDPQRYIAVPHKHDLDLGRALVMDFMSRELPDHYQDVAQFFRAPGAYGAFKNLLDREGRLEDWYRFEEDAGTRALREWCDENGIRLVTE